MPFKRLGVEASEGTGEALPLDLRGDRGRDHSLNHVVDVNEVAGLLAVAVDARSLPAEDAVAEDRAVRARDGYDATEARERLVQYIGDPNHAIRYAAIRALADRLIGMRGVLHGRLAMTTTGRELA